MVYNVPAEESEPVVTSHINGTTEEILARYCITELCKGWPVYRDASEWKNYRSLFAKEGAYVWTSTCYPSPQVPRGRRVGEMPYVARPEADV